MRTIIVGLGAVVMAGGLWSASAVSQRLAHEPAAPSSSSEGTGGAAANETGGSETAPPVVEGESGPPPESSGEVQERTVSLTQAVHFTEATGQDVVVGPGSYRVDAEGTNRIRLLPAETGGAVVVEATSFTHQQTVESPVPMTMPGEDPDVIHIVLVLPNGQVLDARGSYSGVLSRATTRTTLSAGTVQQALVGKGVSLLNQARSSGRRWCCCLAIKSRLKSRTKSEPATPFFRRTLIWDRKVNWAPGSPGVCLLECRWLRRGPATAQRQDRERDLVARWCSPLRDRLELDPDGPPIENDNHVGGHGLEPHDREIHPPNWGA